MTAKPLVKTQKGRKRVEDACQGLRASSMSVSKHASTSPTSLIRTARSELASVHGGVFFWQRARNSKLLFFSEAEHNVLFSPLSLLCLSLSLSVYQSILSPFLSLSISHSLSISQFSFSLSMYPGSTASESPLDSILFN